MNTTVRRSTRLVALAALAATGLALMVGVHVWNKRDFCQGWAEHYGNIARQLRSEAANPAVSPQDRREQLIAADLQDLAARKYATVARMPWRPYPGYPLITPQERAEVTALH